MSGPVPLAATADTPDPGTLITTTMAGVEPIRAASISGALSTVQQLGNAIGVALVGLVFYGAASLGIDVAFERSLLRLAAATLALAVVTSLTGRTHTAS